MRTGEGSRQQAEYRRLARQGAAKARRWRMSRCERPGPRRENPRETRIRAVVDALVSSDSDKVAYLQFARELTAAERHARRSDSPGFRCQKPEFRITGDRTRPTRGRDPSIGVGVTGAAEGASYIVRRPSSQMPDYSMRTKRVVMKWFARGLHGNILWRIGEAILGEVRMTKLE